MVAGETAIHLFLARPRALLVPRVRTMKTLLQTMEIHLLTTRKTGGTVVPISLCVVKTLISCMQDSEAVGVTARSLPLPTLPKGNHLCIFTRKYNHKGKFAI